MNWILVVLGVAHLGLGGVALARSVRRRGVLRRERDELVALESPPIRIMSEFLIHAANLYVMKSVAILAFGTLILLAALPEPVPADRTTRLALLALAAVFVPVLVNLALRAEAVADERKRAYYRTEFRERAGDGYPAGIGSPPDPAAFGGLSLRDLHGVRDELKADIARVERILRGKKPDPHEEERT